MGEPAPSERPALELVTAEDLEPPDLLELTMELVRAEGFDDDLAEIEFVTQLSGNRRFLDAMISDSVRERRYSVAVLALELKYREQAVGGMPREGHLEIRYQAEALSERCLAGRQLVSARIATQIAETAIAATYPSPHP